MMARHQVRGTPAQRLQAWSARAASGCIEFTGKLRKDGYANFKIKGKHHLAHRVAYTIAKGAIPPGLEVRHRCDNRACINPDHLTPGTRQQNVDDCTSQLRHTWGEKVGNARLTTNQVYDIRESTARTSELAERFGVSTKTVTQIRSRKRWAHLVERHQDESVSS